MFAQQKRYGIITLVDQGIVSITNFLTSVIIGRTCSKEELGLYILGFSIVLFIMNFQGSLISAPYMIYNVRFNGAELRKYTGSIFIHQITLSIVSVFCLLLLSLFLSVGFGQTGMQTIIWVLSLVITFILLKELIRRLLFAQLKMKTALLVDLFVSFIQIGGLLILSHLQLLSAYISYIVIGIACALGASFWYILNYKKIEFNVSKAILDLKLNLSFGKWNLASNITTLINAQLYLWFIAIFHGTSSAGILAACLGVINLANPFLLGVRNYLGPNTAHSYANEGKQALNRIVINSTIFITISMLIFCIIMFLTGGKLVVMFYGMEYSNNSFLVSILSLGVFASAVAISVGYGFMAMERPDINFKIDILALCFTVTFGLWIVKTLGVMGVAIGFLSSNCIASSTRTLIYAKYSSNIRKSIA